MAPIKLYYDERKTNREDKKDVYGWYEMERSFKYDKFVTNNNLFYVKDSSYSFKYS